MLVCLRNSDIPPVVLEAVAVVVCRLLNSLMHLSRWSWLLLLTVRLGVVGGGVAAGGVVVVAVVGSAIVVECSGCCGDRLQNIPGVYGQWTGG